MKYLSFIFFTSLLSWTWNVVQTPQKISFETHSAVQTELVKFVRSTILEKKPLATNIKVEKIWTETLSESEMKVQFVYSFDEPDGDKNWVHIELSANGTLKKKSETPSSMPQPSKDVDESNGEDSPKEIWTLSEIHPQHQIINFEEGVNLSTYQEEEAETAKPNQKMENPQDKPHTDQQESEGPKVEEGSAVSPSN